MNQIGIESVTPSVTVNDQPVIGDMMTGNITVDEVISDGPGWIVIHNDLFGHPGGVVGYTHVESGENHDVPVTIHTFVATESLFAVLHYDRGVMGSFEYPTPDGEQSDENGIVIMPFRISGTTFDSMLMNLTQMAEEAGAV